MSHEYAKLAFVSQYPVKGTRKRINVWHVVLQCPVCGTKYDRLKNTRPSRFRCNGTGKLKSIKRTSIMGHEIGSTVLVEAKVINLRPEREGYVDIEIVDHYYYAEGDPNGLEDSERIRLPVHLVHTKAGK